MYIKFLVHLQQARPTGRHPRGGLVSSERPRCQAMILACGKPPTITGRATHPQRQAKLRLDQNFFADKKHPRNPAPENRIWHQASPMLHICVCGLWAEQACQLRAGPTRRRLPVSPSAPVSTRLKHA
eukprot:scaffold48_cov311-Pinguiococcus_pyrenoidosus.AAC.169